MKRALPLVILLSLILSLFSSNMLPITAYAESISPDLSLKLFGATSQELSDSGVTPDLVIDYGTFLWVKLAPDQIAKLDTAAIPWQLISNATMLDLGGQIFDPLSQPLVFEGSWAPEQQISSPDLQLIQFVGPIKTEWLQALQANELEIVQYIHPFTYIVWGTVANLSQASLASQVRWTGSFAPAYRVLPQYRSLPQATLPTQVLLYRGADTTLIIESIKRLGGTLIDQATIDATLEIALFNLPGNLFSQVSQLAGVYSIQPLATNGGLRGEMSSQINAGNYGASNLAYTGYQDWLSSLSLSGEGVIIADVDSGVDDNHPDLINNMLPCTGSSCAGSSQSNHGTHTAGIMAADGASG
ncbi:MAG: hypothetical protein MUO40_07600, partial [Anaerolineaceae bacterium]|nr:hypothetical protein [Anaerolineaceae bacterium]